MEDGLHYYFPLIRYTREPCSQPENEELDGVKSRKKGVSSHFLFRGLTIVASDISIVVIVLRDTKNFGQTSLKVKCQLTEKGCESPLEVPA